MNDMINDWKPETRSLLKALVAAGFELVGGENGGETFKFDGKLASFVENLIACDEARLYIKTPEGKVIWVYLVLGNEPGTIASDYICHPLLDKVTDAHYAKWEGRKQPTCARPAAIVKQRLKYLRGELRAERISTGELVELQGLAPHIEPGDVELLEAAGIPEGGAAR